MPIVHPLGNSCGGLGKLWASNIHSDIRKLTKHRWVYKELH